MLWRFLSLCLLLLPYVAQATECPSGRISYYEPTARDTLTLNGTALPLTLAKIPPVDADQAMAVVTVESNPISYDLTTTPTAAIGHQALAGATLTLCGVPTMQAFKAINVSGAATLKVTYYRAR